jgi:hypothetical protein
MCVLCLRIVSIWRAGRTSLGDALTADHSRYFVVYVIPWRRFGTCGLRSWRQDRFRLGAGAGDCSGMALVVAVDVVVIALSQVLLRFVLLIRTFLPSIDPTDSRQQLVVYIVSSPSSSHPHAAPFPPTGRASWIGKCMSFRATTLQHRMRMVYAVSCYCAYAAAAQHYCHHHWHYYHHHHHHHHVWGLTHTHGH